VEEGDIAMWCARWTGIPMQRCWPVPSARNCLSSKTGGRSGVIGQPRRLAAVAASIAGPAGMQDPRRPGGVPFLFLGPPHRGRKTELAKALAGGAVPMRGWPWCASILSEFMERNVRGRLLGRPPGLRGLREGASSPRRSGAAPMPCLAAR